MQVYLKNSNTIHSTNNSSDDRFKTRKRLIQMECRYENNKNTKSFNHTVAKEKKRKQKKLIY